MIAGTKLDRRVKLSPEDRQKICRLYNGGMSQQKLATAFGVHRSTISMIVDPVQLERWKATYKRRGGSKRYYSSAANTKKIQNYRAYLKFLDIAAEKCGGWSVLKNKDADVIIRKFRRYGNASN